MRSLFTAGSWSILFFMSRTFAIRRNGTELVGESWLTDGPAMVLLHAGVADRRSWYALVPEVSEVASVVAYDRRGFGETLPGSEPFTHLDDLLAVLDQLEIQSAWLVGSSAGGKLALEAAVEVPHRVEGLVLMSPAVGGAPPTRPEDVDSDTERLDEAITRAEELGDLDEVNRLEVRLWLDGPREPEGRVAGSVRDLVSVMNATALANLVPEFANHPVDAWSRLGELSVPTTVACGALDPLHVIRRSEVIAGLIRNAQYVALEGVAHFPYMEDPATVGALIRSVM